MRFHRVGGACAAALLAACGSTTIVEIVNPTADAGGKSMDGASSSFGDDAGQVDATVGTADGGASDTGVPGADAPIVFVPVDAGCPSPDLRCHVDACSGPGTSISGTVYDPAGKNPLPHAYVFVPTDPNGKLPAIGPGAKTCNTCDLPIGSYVAATMSDASGAFSLTGVPTGTHVPIVVQLGKWRREVFATTTSCQNTVLTPALTRLPATQSEGDMPAMALVTGGADNLGCLLAGIGISAQEFKSPHAGGRLDVYKGLPAPISGLVGGAPGLSNGTTAGDCTSDNANCVWQSKSNLEAYDIVLLSCQGSTFDATLDAGGSVNNVTAASKQAMHDWLGEGGKVFATHFHYTWFANGPSDFQGLATWLGSSNASGQGTYMIETSFPKAQDFANGLADAGLTTNGGLAMTTVGNSVSSVNPPGLAWIKDPSDQHTKYLSFTTPVGGACGKAAFSDAHAGGAPSGDLPASCTSGTLTAEEKALELLFFDLSACVSDDTKAPPGPPRSN
jgi:hypothetical protein